MDFVWQNLYTVVLSTVTLTLSTYFSSALKNFFIGIWERWSRLLYVNVVISDEYDIFHMCRCWLAARKEIRESGNYNVIGKESFSTSIYNSLVPAGAQTEDELDSNVIHRSPIWFTLMPGKYVLQLETGQSIEVTYCTEAGKRKKAIGTIIFSMYSFRWRTPFATRMQNSKFLKKLIRNIEDDCTKAQGDYIAVYTNSFNSYTGEAAWKPMKCEPKRSFNQIYLPPGVEGKIINGIQKFFDSREEYLKRGIPYKYNLLFHGEPGTGKTSTVKAIASHFGVSMYMLHPKCGHGGEFMSETAISDLISKTPVRSIIFVEEIDTIMPQKRNTDTNYDVYFEKASQTALKTFLQILDGISTQYGRIIIMTTNYLEKLDSALIRSGRTDLLIEFTSATKTDIQRVFVDAFPQERCRAYAAKFAQKVINNKLTIADVQHYLLQQIDARSAVDNIGLMLDRKKLELKLQEKNQQVEILPILKAK